MLTFQALANSMFLRPACGVNISCRLSVLQADLFLKIYSSLWLSQNFLGYSSIALFFSTTMGIGKKIRREVIQTETLVSWKKRQTQKSI
jgi:hypothetical protein